jgi:hypothetical protein
MLRQGTRAQVMHGTALKTTGGLRRNDLKYNKQGKIVSRVLSTKAKKEKRLERAGWTVRKGEFGAVQMKGGDKFEIGESINPKYLTSSLIKNTKTAVTPMPAELKDLSPTNTISYPLNSQSPFASTCVKINNNGIIKILEQIYKKYDLGNVPKDVKVQPSRKLIMYLGKPPSIFKSYIKNDEIWGKKLKPVLGDISKYNNIASRNSNSYIKGIKLNSDNIGEQTLWKIALNDINIPSLSNMYKPRNPNPSVKPKKKKLKKKKPNKNI